MRSFSAKPKNRMNSIPSSSAPNGARKPWPPASAARRPGVGLRTYWPSGSWKKNCATSSKTTRQPRWPLPVPRHTAQVTWVVLKFGGTSVSIGGQLAQHRRACLRDRLAEGLRPVVVHSALSGITDRLESLLAAALAGKHSQRPSSIIETTTATWRNSLGIVPSAHFEAFLADLHRMAAKVAAVPRDRRSTARSRHGDGRTARDLARRSVPERAGDQRPPGAMRGRCCVPSRVTARPQKAGLLSATCDFAPDVRPASRMACARSGHHHPGIHCGQ